MAQLAFELPEFSAAELDDLLDFLGEPEETTTAADDAPLGHKPLPPPTPVKIAPAMAVHLGSRRTAPSPFAVPELQSFAPRTATPAPSPRRSSTRRSHEPFRSVSFRSLAPKRSLLAEPEQQQPQPPLVPQLAAPAPRAASCVAVPRLQSQAAAAPRAFSAGASTLPPLRVPAVPHAPDSALAWAAGFSRLATQLGCAAPAPSGGLWDPPESTDLLVLLTLELSCCSRTTSPKASPDRSSGGRAVSGSVPSGSMASGSTPSLGTSASPSHKRKAWEEPAWPHDSQASANQRLRPSPPSSPVCASLLS
jgi:hypothetical protein